MTEAAVAGYGDPRDLKVVIEIAGFIGYSRRSGKEQESHPRVDRC